MVLIVAFAAALMATPGAMWLARRVDLLDRPGELKVQTSAVPYLGGLGVAAGLAVGIGAGRPALLLPLGTALGLGVLDDARHIPAAARLLAEVAIGLTAAAVLPGTRGPLGVLAVTIAVVVLVNGVNMIDGLDGLAAGVALMSAAGFALVLGGDDRSVALALVGGLGGFLVFNRPPARVYLGDGGAYLIGAALAVLLCSSWSRSTSLSHSLALILLVACPAAEIGFAVLRRARSRARLFAGDRGHIYDQLTDTGWSRSRAVLAYIALQALLTGVGVGAVRLTPVATAVLVGACCVGLSCAVAALGFLAPKHPEAA